MARFTQRRRMLAALCALIAVGSIAFSNGAANAGPPAYYLLQTPPAHQHGAPAGYYPGRGYGVTTNTYAYGWFGARYRTHNTRTFGYYRDYTQWSRY